VCLDLRERLLRSLEVWDSSLAESESFSLMEGSREGPEANAEEFGEGDAGRIDGAGEAGAEAGAEGVGEAGIAGEESLKQTRFDDGAGSEFEDKDLLLVGVAGYDREVRFQIQSP